MFEPWVEAWAWVKAHKPRIRIRKPRLNFIIIHYLYLILMAIIGSIMVYPSKNIPYIDCLFLATGSATQSGLNTVDLNTINLYQQIVLILLSCLCTPIFINTFVVFIRLYWFEKRFQNVVAEARQLRRMRSRSKSKSEAAGDRDPTREEFGVGTREIKVLRAENGEAQGNKMREQFSSPFPSTQPPEIVVGDMSNGHSVPVSLTTSPTTRPDEEQPIFTRDVVFADEVRRPSTATITNKISNTDRIPEQRTADQHIAFVENQRNPKDKGTLRIPGPRDFDLGHGPQRVEEGEDGGELENQSTMDDADAASPRNQQAANNDNTMDELNADDHPFKHHITIDEPDHPRRTPGLSAFAFPRRRGSAATDVSAAGMSFRRRRLGSFASFTTFASSRSHDADPMPYLSYTPTIARNSNFVDLSEEQREELGGIEYRALKTLAFILVLYYIGFHLLGIVCLTPWIVRSKRYSDIVRNVGESPTWWGIFTPMSMFNDLGFAITPDSMVSFQTAAFPLLLGGFLIVIGNTGFPCMLRFIIWISAKLVPHGSGIWEELRFLLDHPRRCFTLLFPSKATWWLFWILVLFNGLDLILFIILDIKDSTVLSLSPATRVLDGLFQAVSTRTAGLSVVNLAELHPAVQVSYLIMMYISVFPIAISLRRTNVYEERSLGVYSSEEDDSNNQSYVGAHLRRQLSFDLWYVFLGFFVIAIVEGRRLENTNEYAFTLFSVLFEIVSAYGTVGLSLGYPGFNTSFSGQFKTLSKLVIISMQLRGRHRGLPYALDRAILLPSESLDRKEREDAARRVQRRNSAISMLSAYQPGQPPVPGNIQHPFTAPPTLSRRGSAATERSMAGGLGLTKLLSGALVAGPAVQREKRA